VNRDLVSDTRDTELAIKLIEAGARVQMIKELIPSVSDAKCSALYKAIKGKERARGMLPWGGAWFEGIHNCLHGSIFMACLAKVRESAKNESPTIIYLTAYELYSEAVGERVETAPLNLTRAWMLDKFVSTGVLALKKCYQCRGSFVTDPLESRTQKFYCLVCKPNKPGKKSYDEKFELFPNAKAGRQIPKELLVNSPVDSGKEREELRT